MNFVDEFWKDAGEHTKIQRCSCCGKWKSLIEFVFRKDTNKYRGKCKACNKEFCRNKYKNHGRHARTKKILDKYFINVNKNKIKTINIEKDKKRDRTAERAIERLPETKILNVIKKKVKEILHTNIDRRFILNFLGCTRIELKNYIESQFYNNPEYNLDMSWNNYGFFGWRIELKNPITIVDQMNNEEKMKLICNYINYRPIWNNEKYLNLENKTKLCNECNMWKDFGEFRIRDDTGKPRPYCRECANKKCRDDFQKNKEHFVEYRKQYRIKNLYDLRKKRADRERKRKANDSLYKIVCNLKGAVKRILRNPSQSKFRGSEALRYLGCTPEEFKKHIESLWLSGMTWNNWKRGGWNLDHIIPICSIISVDDEEQIKKVFHYSNMRPLWQKDNLKKLSEDLKYKKERISPKNKSSKS